MKHYEKLYTANTDNDSCICNPIYHNTNNFATVLSSKQLMRCSDNGVHEHRFIKNYAEIKLESFFPANGKMRGYSMTAHFLCKVNW